MTDKPRKADLTQRHELCKRLRDQAGLLKKIDEVAEHWQTSAPTQKLLIAAADALDAQAAEIAALMADIIAKDAAMLGMATATARSGEQNAALREALDSITHVELPEHDNLAWRAVVQTIKRIARAALEASK